MGWIVCWCPILMQKHSTMRIRKKCTHNKELRRCVQCKGKNICVHDKEKRRCRECSGVSICEHNHLKFTCRICIGSSFCIHKRYRHQCVECRGGSTCEHSKLKVRCNICSPSSYMIGLLRRRTTKLIKSNKFIKDKTTLKYLGCSEAFFCEYINNKMSNWNKTNDEKMTMQNIQIDHIKPCSTVTCQDQIAYITHFTNMQPLLAKDNLFKSDKWSMEDEVHWLLHIYNNINFDEIYWPKACK